VEWYPANQGDAPARCTSPNSSFYLKKWTEGVAESGIENMRKGERIIVGEAILDQGK
jgi:hypothetical protein